MQLTCNLQVLVLELAMLKLSVEVYLRFWRSGYLASIVLQHFVEVELEVYAASYSSEAAVDTDSHVEVEVDVGVAG